MTDTITVSRGVTRTRLPLWFATGVGVGLFLMLTQALALGGWTTLLAVGEDAPIRSVIESELPGVVLVPDDGNDGQIYYAIGLEPFSDEYAELLPEASLRWRRILVPAAASLFGLLDGYPLFWMMAALVATSLGVATAAVSDIARSLHLKPWVSAVILIHPGLWIGVRLLSPDIPALALSLTAVAMALRKRNGATAILLSLAVLTKEPYLVVACSLAAWAWFDGRRRVGLVYFTVPTAVLAAWSAIVRELIPGTVFESGNIAAPFMGILEASKWWPEIDAAQNARTALALIMVGLAIFIGARFRGHPLLHWLLWPWVGLALIASHWVWRFGNGSLRAFAIIGVVAALMAATQPETAHVATTPNS